MEKHILHWSYWLGIASLIIAVVWKALSAFGLGSPMLLRDQSISYLTFYKASLLLFVAAIASSNYASFKSQRA
jgi:hypothetical protein